MSLVDTARTLGRDAGARSAEIEANRTLPLDLVDALAGAGLFKLFVPRAYGGSEVDVATGVDVIEELAYHDGSTAWCVMIGMTTGLLAAFLEPDSAKAVFGADNAVTGGLAAPCGSATTVDGGLEISGRWQWGSGTQHCTSVGGGCRLEHGTAFVFFDRDDVEFIDTWYVAGLQGTGSTDYAVTNAFVPDGRWVTLPLGAPVVDGALYRVSFFGALAVGIAAVTLGLARRAIDELVDVATVKVPQGSGRLLAERAATQTEVAVAEAEVRSARALLDSALADSSSDQPRLLRLAATFATTTAARAVDRMYTTGGGSAVYLSSALQRVFRDVHVATQHAMVAPRTFELTGRLRLGLESDTRQL